MIEKINEKNDELLSIVYNLDNIILEEVESISCSVDSVRKDFVQLSKKIKNIEKALKSSNLAVIKSLENIDSKIKLSKKFLKG